MADDNIMSSAVHLQDDISQPAPPRAQALNILSPLSLYDVIPIRRIAYHVRSMLGQPMDSETTDFLPPLGDYEKIVVGSIQTILYPAFEFTTSLFSKICDKFASSYDCSDDIVLKAARDFDTIAISAVIKPTPENAREYELAKAMVELMESTGKYDYRAQRRPVQPAEQFDIHGGTNSAGLSMMHHQPQGYGLPHFGSSFHSPYALFEQGDDGLGVLPEFGSLPAATQSDYSECSMVKDNFSQSYSGSDTTWVNPYDGGDEYSMVEAGFNASGSIPVNGGEGSFSSSQGEHEDDDEGDADYICPYSNSGEGSPFPDVDSSDSEQKREGEETDDDDVEEARLKLSLQQSNKGLSKPIGTQKHKAVRKRGEKPFDLGKNDKTPAQKGVKDFSKCRIDIPTFRPDPKEESGWARSEDAVYTYGHVVDWFDSKSIGLLNQWRCQLFRRNYGTQRPTRAAWTKQELATVISILRKHAAGQDVRGRWSKIDWNVVTNEFNQTFRGHVFPEGEPAVGPTKAITLKRETVFDGRSATAIKSQVEGIADPRAKAFVESLKGMDEKDRLDIPGEEEFVSDALRQQMLAAAAATRDRKRKSEGDDNLPFKRSRSSQSAENDSIAPSLSGTPVLPYSNATKVIKKTRAKQAPRKKASTMIDSAKRMPVANMMMNQPKTFLFQHSADQSSKPISSSDLSLVIPKAAPVPKASSAPNTSSRLISPPFDDDMTEDEDEGEALPSTGGEHPFIKLCRETRESKDGAAASSPREIVPACPSAQALSPFQDIAAPYSSDY